MRQLNNFAVNFINSFSLKNTDPVKGMSLALLKDLNKKKKQQQQKNVTS